MARAASGRRRRRRRGVEGDRRGDALRARCPTTSATSSPPGYDELRPGSRWRAAAGRRPLERARRGRRGRDVRRPAGELTSGCAALEQVCDAVRDCWASLYTPARDRLPGGTRRGRRGAGDGRHGAGDGRRRGLGRAVHLQPGQRRPEHGRDQRELGARPGGRGRRGHAGRLPRQQGHRRGGAPARCTPSTSSTCRLPAGRGTVRDEVPDERRDGACLDEDALRRWSASARRVESHFGSHQDVEWALARERAAPDVAARAPGAARDDAAGAASRRPSASAMSLVMSTFGAPPGRRRDRA